MMTLTSKEPMQPMRLLKNRNMETATYVSAAMSRL